MRSPTTTNTDARKKALESALAQIERQHGKGSIMKLGGEGAVQRDITAVSSGSLGLDIALGIGGYPEGRIVEIYGPESSGKTTMMLHAVAEAQKAGGVCAFVDAEHALDPKYAKALGVDLDELLISQPDTGEQALDIVDTLVRSGAVNMIVIDSVAALTPKSELDGDMGDSSVGVHARLMSQAMRKLAGQVSRNNVTVFFINQIRMKIGVMFGCFHYNARVHLADGTTEKIGKIVNQRMNVEVLTFNGNTGQIEPKKIKNWFDNGKADQFLNIKVTGGKSGTRHLPVTRNHTVFTPTGEVSAGELQVGDEILATSEDYVFDGQSKQVLLGTVLGDASVRLAKSGNRGTIRFGHGHKQNAYAKWKHSFFKTVAGNLCQNSDGKSYFDIKTNAFAKQLHDWIRISAVPARKGLTSRCISQDMIEQMEALAFATWYMDDGTFNGCVEKWGKGRSSISAKATDTESLQKVSHKLQTLLGISPTVTEKGIHFSSNDTFTFHKWIAEFVPTEMEYKIHPKLRGGKKSIKPNPEQDISTKKTVVSETIKEISIKPQTRGMQKFDLEIEDNHCYLVDGVVVHNSPETTTGGNALKFYASVRLDIRRIGALKDRDETIGNQTRVKVVKNKVAPPFKQVEFDILYGEGVSKMGEIIDLGVKHGIVDKSGSWFSYGSERIGQGKEKARQFLKDNPDMCDEIEQKIRKITMPELDGNTPEDKPDADTSEE